MVQKKPVFLANHLACTSKTKYNRNQETTQKTQAINENYNMCKTKYNETEALSAMLFLPSSQETDRA